MTNRDPKPINLVNWRFYYDLVDFEFVLNWLSGALVGVGGSDVIGHIILRTNNMFIHHHHHYYHSPPPPPRGGGV